MPARMTSSGTRLKKSRPASDSHKCNLRKTSLKQTADTSGELVHFIAAATATHACTCVKPFGTGLVGSGVFNPC